MNPRPPIVVVTATVLLAAVSFASAYDFVKESPPGRWIDPFVPEELPELTYPSYFTELDKARLQVQRGRYRTALATLAKAKLEDTADGGLLRATALAALGRSQQAMDALAQPQVVDDPRAHVLLARIQASIGMTDEAIALMTKHLEAHPDSIAGHYELGRLNEQVGDLEAARRAYGWFVEDAQLLDKWQGQVDEPVFESAETVTTIARALDRWAALTGAYRDNAQLHDLLLNMFVKAYDVIDRGYQPAHVAAAEYFLSHDNRQEAGKELEAALESNPRDVAALRLAGTIALDNFNFDGVDQVIGDMRSVDRDSAVADLLETRSLLHQRRPKDAFAPVERVLKRQPRNLEALGLLAAAQALRLEDEKAAATLKRIEALDPDNATAYFEVAEQLGAMRQYPRSADHYKIAIARAPWWTAPRNGLGLLYTQSGDEDDARTTLDAAHALDPFNIATTNYLRLLDDMAKFARVETEHFIVFYDAAADPIIPEYFGEYLESIHDEVSANFRHEPSVKTYIEVFPTHDMFSVRTTGSPWIGTVGASTGRVIALVSPRKGKMTMGAFNWAAVLRHEYTHTVTLSATDNRIAHWMTEGLAVLEENTPLKWEWVPMLNRAVKRKELFTLDNLTWAFVRPRKPSDRQLAYAQSFWICQYIDQVFGREKLLGMMESFRNGRNDEETFSQVLGKSIESFQTDFVAWTEKQVAGWGYDPQTTKQVDAIRPEAEKLLEAREYEKALPLWQKLHQLRPMEPTPHMRLAAIFMRLKRVEDAVKHLEALDAVEIKDNRYAKAIGRIYRDEGKLPEAAKHARQAVYIDPYDEAAHELLADIYEKTGNQDGLERERRVLRVLKEWRGLQRQRPDEISS